MRIGNYDIAMGSGDVTDPFGDLYDLHCLLFANIMARMIESNKWWPDYYGIMVDLDFQYQEIETRIEAKVKDIKKLHELVGKGLLIYKREDFK